MVYIYKIWCQYETYLGALLGNAQLSLRQRQATPIKTTRGDHKRLCSVTMYAKDKQTDRDRDGECDKQIDGQTGRQAVRESARQLDN